jgi:hypothetical protein
MGPRGDSGREMLVLGKGVEYLNCMSAVRKGRNIGNWHVRQLCASGWMQQLHGEAQNATQAVGQRIEEPRRQIIGPREAQLTGGWKEPRLVL